MAIKLKFILPAICLLFAQISAICQSNNHTNNTTIKNAKNVDIKNSQVSIAKADSVIIHTTMTAYPKVYLIGIVSTKDTQGIYTTLYRFATKEMFRTFVVDISLKFDKPFIPCQGHFCLYAQGERSPIVSSETLQTELNINNTYLHVFGNPTSPVGILDIKIMSKEPPIATIDGIEGKLF
jgi:hypothetical protein